MSSKLSLQALRFQEMWLILEVMPKNTMSKGLQTGYKGFWLSNFVIVFYQTFMVE